MSAVAHERMSDLPREPGRGAARRGAAQYVNLGTARRRGMFD